MDEEVLNGVRSGVVVDFKPGARFLWASLWLAVDREPGAYQDDIMATHLAGVEAISNALGPPSSPARTEWTGMPEPKTVWGLKGLVIRRRVWDKMGPAYETTIHRAV